MATFKLRCVVFGLIILLILAGCRAGQVSVQRDGAGNLDISVKISEADINTSIQNILSSSQGLKLQNATVDLQNGQILVTGDYTKPDGSSGHGSLTLTMTVQDGAVLTQISSLNLEGWTAESPAIQQINQRLTADFQRRATRTDNLRTQSVTITDSEVDIQFEAHRSS
ncbi:MAG: DUF2993 domain-containing protein [Chloroflexi bacterium]|nr:DUF2993 domain-containing protein [Chloroflexota bacterium]